MRDRFKAFIFAILGGATVLPIGREYIKSLFWDRIVQLMNPVIEPVYSALQNYGIPTVFGISAVYFAIGDSHFIRLRAWGRRMLNWYLVASAVFCAAAVAAIGLYFWDRSRGPIIFSWKAPAPIMLGRSGDVYKIDGFQVSGENRWDAPISNIRTYIRSNKTAKIVPLMFMTNGPPQPADRIVIQGNRPFGLVSVSVIIPEQSPSIEAFLLEFPSFLFSFEADGVRVSRNFDEAEVNLLVSDAMAAAKKQKEEVEKAMGVGRGPGFGVTVKSPSHE
ncbi:hypothetical protein AB7714_28400 [Tardiphaga sp. 1201_B9_N1_1]|uniref:hypothetical protein n=1 Tax=unclassified Tardiphaga TaxID=2631404 RepID=UPI003F20E03C